MGRRVAAIGTLVCLVGFVITAMAQQPAEVRNESAKSSIPVARPGLPVVEPSRSSPPAQGPMPLGVRPRTFAEDEEPGGGWRVPTDEEISRFSPDELVRLLNASQPTPQHEWISRALANVVKDIGEPELGKIHSAGLAELWPVVQSDSDREKVQKALREAVKREFLARLQPQEEEVKALEARVQQLRKQLDLRRSKQDEIVDFRTQQLLREAQGLGWGAETNTGRMGMQQMPGSGSGAGGRGAMPSSDPMRPGGMMGAAAGGMGGGGMMGGGARRMAGAGPGVRAEKPAAATPSPTPFLREKTKNTER
jgi:hypothetical protein